MSCFMLKSLSHFECIFVHGMRVCSKFIGLHAAVQLCQHHLLEETVFHFIFLPPLWKTDGWCVGLFLSSLFCSIDPCLFLYQYHTVLISVILSYSLKSGSLIPLARLFFLTIVSAVWGVLCFHTNLNFPSSVKNAIGNLVGIA